MKYPMPDTEGYYWAKWKIAADDTPEGDELTPSSDWEIVAVFDNNSEIEPFYVTVFGVHTNQWPDCFVWGPKISDLRAGPVK